MTRAIIRSIITLISLLTSELKGLQLESIFEELSNKYTIALTIKSYLRRIVEFRYPYVDKSLGQTTSIILEL